MKLIWFVVGFALCADLNANVAAYRIDKQAKAALEQWFKKAEDNQSPETRRGK